MEGVPTVGLKATLPLKGNWLELQVNASTFRNDLETLRSDLKARELRSPQEVEYYNLNMIDGAEKLMTKTVITQAMIYK
jgi:hypothetical protein